MISEHQLAEGIAQFVVSGTGPFYTTLTCYLSDTLSDPDISEAVSEYRAVLGEFLKEENNDAAQY